MRAAKVVPYACLCAAALFFTACQHSDKSSEPEQLENASGGNDFASLYRRNCSGCHGEDGRQGPARILNDALYLSIIPRAALKQVLVYGRAGTQMPAWAESQGGPLTDQQIDILVDGIYSHWGKDQSAPAGAPAYAASSAGDVAHGKQLFLRDCFMCHAKGMNPGPITTRSYLQLASNQMLRTSIIVGRSDLGMPAYQFLNMGKPLSDQDVTDLVAYLNSRRVTPAPGEMNEPAGQPGTATGPHENENGSGHTGGITKGNEGSGTGPGSATQREQEGKSGSSQQGVK